MVRVVVAAHGDLAVQLLKSAEDLLGALEGVYALNFTRQQSTGELVVGLGKILSAHKDDYIFILTDFLGGSPCNCACHFIAEKNVRVISGVNLPMLIEIMVKRDKLGPDELCADVIKVARASIEDVCARFSECPLPDASGKKGGA